MSWSLVKETAARDLMRHGVAYHEALALLADILDVEVPAAVAAALAPDTDVTTGKGPSHG